MSTKTPEQIKAEFKENGTSVSSWATAHGYTPQDVYKVLNGQVKGNFGKGHQIAVQLGIKAKPAA